MIRLAFLVLGLTASTALAGGDPLSGCKMEQESPSTRSFECDRYSASYTDMNVPGVSEDAVGTVYVDLTKNFAQKFQVEPPGRKPVWVRARARPTFSTRVLAKGKPIAQVFVVGLEVPGKQGTRAASCTAMLLDGATPEGCVPILEALVSQPAILGPAATQKVLIGGKELQVPAGCKGTSQDIECGESNLVLSTMPVARTLDEMSQKLQSAFAQTARMSATKMACTVGTKKTTCALLTMEKKQEPKLFLLLTVEDDGRSLIECATPSDPRTKLVPPCGLAFAL